MFIKQKLSQKDREEVSEEMKYKVIQGSALNMGNITLSSRPTTGLVAQVFLMRSYEQMFVKPNV